jgi:hypothetical protein
MNEPEIIKRICFQAQLGTTAPQDGQSHKLSGKPLAGFTPMDIVPIHGKGDKPNRVLISWEPPKNNNHDIGHLLGELAEKRSQFCEQCPFYLGSCNKISTSYYNGQIIQTPRLIRNN